MFFVSVFWEISISRKLLTRSPFTSLSLFVHLNQGCNEAFRRVIHQQARYRVVLNVPQHLTR